MAAQEGSTAGFAKPQDEDTRTFTVPADFRIQAVDAAIAAQDPNISIEPFLPSPTVALAAELLPQAHPPQAPVAPTLPQPIGPPGVSNNPPAPGALGIALDKLVGTFTGQGLNMIFRPRNGPDATGTRDNLLEYDLTEETLQFLSRNVLKDVPNRGFGSQPDVNLRGIPYQQNVANVLDPVTVQANSALKTDIHFEQGLFIRTPALKNPAIGATISRMGSIPHGTTINAQGLDPTAEKPGKPTIPPRSIVPFGARPPHTPVPAGTFANMTYENNVPDLRIPAKFPPGAAITKAIFNDPTEILRQNNDKKNIDSHIEFTVSTVETLAQPGGGTANIGFLTGPGAPVTLSDSSTVFTHDATTSNANAIKMEATFWISKVRHTVEIPPWFPGAPFPIVKPLDTHQDVQAPNAFQIQLDRPILKPTKITVFSTQIQYSQLVLLDFGPLSWPHISVATLVPAAADKKDFLVVDLTHKGGK
jgi:hypothetical protein